MERYVLDTNCLLMAIPRRSPYHKILTALFAGKYALCVSTDILKGVPFPKVDVVDIDVFMRIISNIE